MNIGYVFDLSGLLKETHISIPVLKDLAIGYCYTEKANDLTIAEIIRQRDSMLLKSTNRIVDKHLFFFVLDYEKQSVENLSKCVAAIQGEQMFDQQHYEIHVLCNFSIEGGDKEVASDIAKYEKAMPVLTDNRNCVYTWVLSNYDDNGGIPVVNERKIRVAWRLIWMLCNHRREIALQQMTQNKKPIYYLFGDSSLFFDEEQRNANVRNYYNFKNLQHLLNLPDAPIEEFMMEHVLPFKDKPEEVEKRLDHQAESFLKNHRVPIEASAINAITQNLLIKSSDDDQEYLVDVKDDSLVFVDDLARKQDWRLRNADTLLRDFNNAVENGEEPQEILTNSFLNKLEEDVIAHKRILENDINNAIAKSSEKQINTFREHTDKRLMEFLNKHDNSNYDELEESLLESEVIKHCSNLDYGIAFLEYLAEGKSDYLVDQEVAVGDISFEKIRRHAVELREKRFKDVKEKEKQVREDNSPGFDGELSKVRAKFKKIDQRINNLGEEIEKMNHQIERWWDSDAKRKLTVRSRAAIAALSGLVVSFVWLFISLKWIKPLFSKPENWRGTQWWIFALLLSAGIIACAVILWQFFSERNRVRLELKRAKNEKKALMHDCVEDKKSLVELRYLDKLAYHALKTINELIEITLLKKKDLESYRNALFKQMIKYKLSLENGKPQRGKQDDFNTIELEDHVPARILFGPDKDNGNKIPYCFAQGGVELSKTFDIFRNKKAMLETTRFDFDYVPEKNFDKAAIAKEVIPARQDDESENLVYTELDQVSVLPTVDGVEMDDVHQGYCGDCYFMATLASIAQMDPNFIVGEHGLIEELDPEEHKFFRVRFYDSDANRVDIDINNKFWTKNGEPFYARKGKSSVDDGIYDPWVMAVEKAWAKANNAGYDGIEAASGDGVERKRKVEYSFAVTGKSAFYCMTKNVPNSAKLAEMIKKHYCEEHKPITLYSASKDDPNFKQKDQYLVTNHAYALRSVNDDGTFDIFNPWNSRPQGVRGQHYDRKDIGFIKDNFDVVVFFDIKESEFASFERKLTGNAQQNELTAGIEKVLNEQYKKLELERSSISTLLNDEVKGNVYTYSSFLFNTDLLRDKRDVQGGGQPLFYVEGTKDYADANQQIIALVNSKGDGRVEGQFVREDSQQSITLLRVSPQYVLDNFIKLGGNDNPDGGKTT